jgi:hypothetical protein
MDALNPLLVEAHVAETRERILASAKPRRKKRRSSPWVLLRRVGDALAGRRVRSTQQGEQVRRPQGRVLEA